MNPSETKSPETTSQRWWQRTRRQLGIWAESDFLYAFWRSKITVVAFIWAVILLIAGLLSHWLAPHPIFDASSFDLMDSELPPAWMSEGDPRFWLGSDVQGRDLLSLMLFGLHISLIVGLISVSLSVVFGCLLGVLSGYFGGWLDTLIMRFADAMLSIPTIMFALLLSGVARGIIPKESQEAMAMPIIVVAITLTGWMQYARTIRSLTLLEKRKEYVLASRISGGGHLHIMFAHILPNVTRPIFVLATLHLGLAILTEATLSFLGVGMPPDQPSLGTLINEGNQYLFSGQWWVVLFPAIVLVTLSLAFNILGDWLRDVLNPKLQQGG
ncbi:Dipeptide transport system permease protein DppC [Paramixta manurensis]|uniref:Dipeptide transport system permease protein DppC n=1 Tax=Paramixta manurensis TaxID=2740817 RepID=A0A6M8UBK2_9GAMM|nr:Dipeptide transport system permease protein DppC [Erwiniaceae bacterium PD-1]